MGDGGVLVGSRSRACRAIDGVTGDEQVTTCSLVQSRHCLANVTGEVAANVYHGIPAAAPKRLVVTGMAVANQPGKFREQLRAGPAPAEDGDLGPGAAGLLHDRPAHERGAPKNQYSHGSRCYLKANSRLRPGSPQA